MLDDAQADRANQAALGYFWGWIVAMTKGDRWVKAHSRITDGDRGGIHNVRVEVDGQLLMVVPWDPDYRPRARSLPTAGGVIRTVEEDPPPADPPPAKLEADPAMTSELPGPFR